MVYLVTDGGDNNSKISKGQIQKELAQRATRIFVLLPNDKQAPRTQEEMLGPPMMEDLVEETGGFLMVIPWASADDRADLLRAAPFLQSDIGSSYRMQLALPKPIRHVVALQVRYTGPDRRLGKYASWFYPRHIGPCPAPPHP